MSVAHLIDNVIARPETLPHRAFELVRAIDEARADAQSLSRHHAHSVLNDCWHWLADIEKPAVESAQTYRFYIDIVDWLRAEIKALRF